MSRERGDSGRREQEGRGEEREKEKIGDKRRKQRMGEKKIGRNIRNIQRFINNNVVLKGERMVHSASHADLTTLLVRLG